MVNSAEFAKRLDKLFDFYDLNASSFAEKIDVGRASISHLLSGRNKPSLDFVMKVVQTFPEVELYWLLNGKGKFPKDLNEKPKEFNEPFAPTQPLVSKTTNISNEEPQKLAHEVSLNKLPTQKEVKQIILLYTDGTFETFNPA